MMDFISVHMLRMRTYERLQQIADAASHVRSERSWSARSERVRTTT